MARPERDHHRLASAATGVSSERRPLEPRHVAAMVILHGIGLGLAVAAFVLEWAAKMPPLR